MPRKKSEEKTDFFNKPKKKECFSIKTSLKSVLLDPEKNLPIIEKLTFDCQEIVTRTYLFLRLFILYKFYEDEEMYIVNRTFILHCIRTLGVKSKVGDRFQCKNKKIQLELDDFYEKEFKSLIPNKEKFSLINKYPFTTYLADQMITAFNVNLKEHFIDRFRRFINITQPEELSKKENFKLSNQLKNSILHDNISQECPKGYRWYANQIRFFYLPQEYEKSFNYDVEVDPQKYLYYTIDMNRIIEGKNNNIDIEISNEPDEKKKEELRKTKKKLYQPIPLRTNNVPGFITLDSVAIISNFNIENRSKLKEHIKQNSKFIFSQIFDLNNKVFKQPGYEFSSVQTDGISLNIIFKKIGRKYGTQNEKTEDTYLKDLSKETLNKLKKKKVVVIDPGKKSLAQMMDEDGNTLRYTAVQRKFEIGSKRNEEIMLIEKSKTNVQELEDKLSDENCKTVNYEKFKNYIRKKYETIDEISEFYRRELFRKQRFRTYTNKQRSEDKFINNVEKVFGKKEDNIYYCGDWSQTHLKHQPSTLGKGMRKIFKQRGLDLFLINECNTSKLCHKCHSELKNYNGKHHVKYCDNKCISLDSRKHTFINRDINACYNMIYLVKQWLNNGTRDPLFTKQISAFTE